MMPHAAASAAAAQALLAANQAAQMSSGSAAASSQVRHAVGLVQHDLACLPHISAAANP